MEDQIVPITAVEPETAEPRLVYINAYSVERCYGGREEGGRWYDAGEPLASVPVNATDEALIALEKKRLEELFAPDFPDRSDPRNRLRRSVNGGADLEIYVEDRIAEAFPKETPHHE